METLTPSHVTVKIDKKEFIVKTQLVNQRFPMYGFSVFVSFVLSVVPASATDFEVGTQFGISHIIPDDEDVSVTLTEIPSGLGGTIGVSPSSLYTMWFPNKRFGMGPEFQFGRLSVTEEHWDEKRTESLTSLVLGGRAVYFLGSRALASPYVLGRVSSRHLIMSDADNDSSLSLGFGFGYQWLMRSAFVLRTELQYQRLFDDEAGGNIFSLNFGIGTRFRKDDNPVPLK